MGVAVRVTGLPDWVDAPRILGDGDWESSPDGWTARLERPAAADLQARLRGIGIGGSPIAVTVQPSLKRALVRGARTADARRRRKTTPGFTRPGCRLDDEGRMSLTAESIALALGRQAQGRSVLDATGGCGGNAIGFARAGCDVVMVEPHSGRLAMARHNARVYGVDHKIRFVAGTAETIEPTLTADLLFADPPWGADWNRLHTAAADLPLLQPLLRLSTRFATTWLKLPPSFAVDTLPGWAPQAWHGNAEGDRRRVKFLLLTLDRAHG